MTLGRLGPGVILAAVVSVIGLAVDMAAQGDPEWTEPFPAFRIAGNGAAYMVMDADVAVVESGGTADFQYGGDAATHYPPTAVDRVLRDGDGRDEAR